MESAKESEPPLLRHPQLEDWRRLTAIARAEALDSLTLRQIALLLECYLTPGPHRVRDLAARLGVPKPAISRALDRLTEKELLRRKLDPKDRRDVLVHRTLAGAVFLSELEAAFASRQAALQASAQAAAQASSNS